MSDAGNPKDYHSLLNLHHSMRLRRSLRGETTAPGADHPAADGPTLDSWPELELDRKLLRESLDLVEPLEDTLQLLYAALFRERPFLRSMFPESLTAQTGRLKWSFLHMIESLDLINSDQSPRELVEVFARSGHDHRKLGVRPAHYTAFGDALIEALRTRAGDQWHPGYEQAWRRAFWFVARLMIEGAEADLSTPVYVPAVVVGHEKRRPDLAVIRVQTKQPYSFVAGQHASVESARLPRTWRYYSMANPPSGDGILEFHVRATGAGRLSDILVHQTQVGESVRLGPAQGTLTLEPTSSRDTLFVAGGTGLAPIRALLGEQARRRPHARTWLFVGARSQADLYDLATLRTLARTWDWLTVVPAVAEPTGSGFETGSVVDAVVRRGDWSGYDAYVSGPRAMVHAMRRGLPALGVPAERVHYDLQ